MPSLQRLRERLTPLLDQLEEGCAQAEAALRARDWEKMREALHDQRRTKQAIINEFAAAPSPAEALPDVAARLRAILEFRDDQLRRLVAFRNDVSERLRTARKWKDAARSARKGLGPTPVMLSRVQ